MRTTAVYQSELSSLLSPLLSKPLSSIESVADEIQVVTSMMHKAANSCIPHCTHRRNRKMYIHNNSATDVL